MNGTPARGRAVGVFGGTFDPVHNGHLRVATEVFEELALAEVRMVPCHVPAHRGAPGATAGQRMQMLRAAIDGQPGLVADPRELDRAGPSYMVDTLASLRAELGADVPLLLLLGADAFAGLPTWHRWRDLLLHAHLVVLTRPGHGSEPFGDELADLVTRVRIQTAAELVSSPSGRILFRPVTPLEISASRIRELVAAGRSPRHLVPETVRNIIERLGLYGSGPTADHGKPV